MLMGNSGWRREGYTKAVDWWSLGVTMYKLLLAKYPFAAVESSGLGGAIGSAEAQGASLDRYEALHDDVDYSAFNSYPELVDLLSGLLTVDDTNWFYRGGYSCLLH